MLNGQHSPKMKSPGSVPSTQTTVFYPRALKAKHIWDLLLAQWPRWQQCPWVYILDLAMTPLAHVWKKFHLETLFHYVPIYIINSRLSSLQFQALDCQPICMLVTTLILGSFQDLELPSAPQAPMNGSSNIWARCSLQVPSESH